MSDTWEENQNSDIEEGEIRLESPPMSKMSPDGMSYSSKNLIVEESGLDVDEESINSFSESTLSVNVEIEDTITTIKPDMLFPINLRTLEIHNIDTVVCIMYANYSFTKRGGY